MRTTVSMAARRPTGASAITRSPIAAVSRQCFIVLKAIVNSTWF